MNRKISLKNVVFDTNFFYLYLVPSSIIPSAIPWVSLKLLVSFMIVVGYFFVVRKFQLSIARSTMLMFPLVIILLTSFSLFYSMSIVIFDDAFEMLRPVCALVFIVFVYQIRWNVHQIENRVYRGCFYIIMFFFALFLLEMIKFPVLGNIHELYRRDMDVLGGKFVGPFFTTYIAGSIILSICSLYCARFIIERKFRFLLLVLMSSFLIFATQSRSAFISYAILICYFYVVAFLVNKGKPAIRLVLVALFLAFLVCLYMLLDWAKEALPYLYSGIKNYAFNFTDHIGTNNSLGKRISQVMWSASENDLYIVGVGILKAKIRLLESWIALYYVRYGLLGMVSYLIFWGSLGIYSVIGARRFFKADELVKSSYLVGFSGIVVSLPPLLLSSVPTDFMPTLFTYYAFATLSIVLCMESSKYRRDKRKVSTFHIRDAETLN